MMRLVRPVTCSSVRFKVQIQVDEQVLQLTFPIDTIQFESIGSRAAHLIPFQFTPPSPQNQMAIEFN